MIGVTARTGVSARRGLASQTDGKGGIVADDPVDEVKVWLGENWDPDITVREWWERLGMSGWAAPAWPVDAYGRGLSNADNARVQRAIADFGALGPPGGLGLLLAGPTIFTHGTVVAQALDAATELEREGFSVRVVDMFTLKPIDEELIAQCAAETGWLRLRKREMPRRITTMIIPRISPNTNDTAVSASQTTTGPAASTACVITCTRS